MIHVRPHVGTPRTIVGRTLRVSRKVIIPSSGGSPKCARVAAIASTIIDDATPAPSFLNAEQTQAPAHACFVYSANGHEVTQKARPLSFHALRTRHRPGGTNCGVPIFWRL